MMTRALADRKYLRRYLLLALGGLGICLWGVYDSVFKFPKELEMASAFDEFRQSPNGEQRWRELYEQNRVRGWTKKMPKNSAAVVRGYINFNKGVMAFGTALMAFFLMKFFRTRGSWMESTETGIMTSWGQALEFARISRINKRKWEDKGIAKVYFKEASGQRHRMIFDDFKYERAKMAKLMAMCERGLSADRIIGGKSETRIATEAADSAPADVPHSGESVSTGE